GAWLVGRAADIMERARLITVGFLGAVTAAGLNLLLVSLAPEFTGGLRWSLLMAVVGPMLIAFAVALLFAPIQLAVLARLPPGRGARGRTAPAAGLPRARVHRGPALVTADGGGRADADRLRGGPAVRAHPAGGAGPVPA